ncbi:MULTISPECIES: hypothetical protein [Kitasatospora]|uniref:hypothetical protein n=1 Tax=Kitasatospora TaxID=2063 RepID=UPI000C273B93|nr:hypothetical protein [Kitasatospora sp. CB02891]PJN21136.1 hypothetical protein CG736_34915 [Kitasatospora sp. CB02891]
MSAHLRRTAVLLLAAVGPLPLVLPTAAATVPVHREMVQEQSIALEASSGDVSAAGSARLTVTKEGDHYRVQGWVEANHGCVELRAVNMHLGDYIGGDSILRTCDGDGRRLVNSTTRHTHVVLTAIVDGGMNWDSKIVKLTGRP